ncbi:uncharacterized protein CBL_12994 [Carabus blaptoides fortunei]
MFRMESYMKGQYHYSRLRYLYDSAIHSDCSFLVDGVEIEAHKTILAAHSPKLEKLLFEPRLDGPLYVPFSEGVMRQVMRFIYCHEQDIFDVNPTDVMDAAFHFQILDLVELSGTKIFISSLSEMYGNLNLACRYNCKTLKLKCLAICRQNSTEVLKNENYFQLNVKSFSYLLGEDVIDVSNETEVITAVCTWITYKKTVIDVSILRTEIDVYGLFKKIRFFTLTDIHTELQRLCNGLFSNVEFDKLMNTYPNENRFKDQIIKQINRTVEIVSEYNPPTFTVRDYVQTKIEVFTWSTKNAYRPYFKSLTLRSLMKVNGEGAMMATQYKEHIDVKMFLNDVFIAYGKFKGFVSYNSSMVVELSQMYESLAMAYSMDTDNIKVIITFHGHGTYGLGPVPNTTTGLVPIDPGNSISLIKGYSCLPCFKKGSNDLARFCQNRRVLPQLSQPRVVCVAIRKIFLCFVILNTIILSYSALTIALLLLPKSEPTMGGCVELVATIGSIILLVVTMPFSLFFCFKVVQEYERAVIFRLGRLRTGGARGPGIFFVLPCIDTYCKVDLRTVSFDVPPQEALTKDSVTVTVDAVVYYSIKEPLNAVVKVTNYSHSTRLLAATTLRNVLGTRNLSEILSDREAISHAMQTTLDEATDPWGVKVERVEIKDVSLPTQLQRAMAAEAEATREARAKVIAAEGEMKASRALKEAADVMSESPAAIQLRYLQTLNTISAEKNSTIIFPLPMDIIKPFLGSTK